MQFFSTFAHSLYKGEKMASFKSAIAFGLVYIPISLSVSVKNNDIGFNMIDKKTMTRVKYKKTCVDCGGKEVSNDDIVKGYQYEKGKYVIFTDKDFDKIKSSKDKTITISQFVNANEIDPIYFDKSYYVQPAAADKAFSVLTKAMEKEKKAAIAKTVLGTKETLILLRVKDGKMIANTMYFYSEVQDAPKVKESKTSKEELTLAINLINQMTKPFKPKIFKDEYNEKIKKAIKQKIAGNEIITHKEKTTPSKIINLMDALQKSLEIEEKPKRKVRVK